MMRTSRSPTFMNRISATAAVFATAAVCGCASHPPPVLEFPGSSLSKSITQQGVRFIVEDEAPDYTRTPGGPRRVGVEIEWDFGKGRKVFYRYKNFIVDGARFPARDADLFLFDERPGAWSFRYRGQDVRVESSEPWIPALYFRVVETTQSPDGVGGAQRREVPVFLQRGGRPVRVTASSQVKYIALEELLVRDHSIVFRPGKGGVWEINGEKVAPRPGRVLILGEDGSVSFGR